MVYLPPPLVFQPLPITSITLISHHRILLEGWKEAPPPKSPEVVHTLKRHQKEDVEGLLAYYDLPLPLPLPLPHDPVKTSFEAVSLSWPDKVKFELHTLPVDAKSVVDGDTITVYVDTLESSSVPRDVQVAAVERSKALASKNYAKANALQKYIVHAGYRAIKASNEEILAQKYRVRLRGIDAPESSMPYGKEAKGELLNLVQGKCLEVHVFGEDRYGRYVGDVYCNGVFVQEWMLRKGFAWHYTTYDQRSQLASWEKQARTARIGLWASTNPEKPWEWRKNQREGRKVVNLFRLKIESGSSPATRERACQGALS